MPQKELVINLEAGWKEILNEEFHKDYFKDLSQFLLTEKDKGKELYPIESHIFNAFLLTPWDQVKVVILGQDPYHNPGQAMGLSFSVPKDFKIPPSLKNIFKELHHDLELDIPRHGDLTAWAEQGVLLLNAMLTVEHKSPGSHKNIGWQIFTDTVIKKLSENKDGLVFLLWGNFAKSKAGLINKEKHLILQAAHPSPLARGAYFGSKHFSKTNVFLKEKGIKEINWQT